MAKRILIIGFSVLACLFLAISLSLWFFLSSWVPTAGKARLIEELQKRAPVTVAIGSMRYEWLHDVVLTDVRVRQRSTGEVWFAAPSMRVHVRWLTLALRKICIFRAESPVEVPFRASAVLSGRYDLRRARLLATLKTDPVLLPAVAPFLRERLPKQLAEGQFHLNVTLRQEPSQPLLIQGRLTAEDTIWNFKPAQLRGRITIDGTAQAPAKAGQNWLIKADGHLERATLERVPSTDPKTVRSSGRGVQGSAVLVEEAQSLQPRTQSRGGFGTGSKLDKIDELKADAHYEDERVTLRQASAKILDTIWKAEAVLEPRGYEFFVAASRASLAPFLATLPEQSPRWDVQGLWDLRAVCRGVLNASQEPDCTVEAATRHTQISSEWLSNPLENVSGQFRFEWLSKEATLKDLSLRILNQGLHADGTVALRQPLEVNLDLRGSVPLAALKDWLPEESPVSDLGGVADVDVKLKGALPEVSVLGRINFERARLTTAFGTFDAVEGALLFREPDAVVQAVRFERNKHLFSLTATITPSPFSPDRDPHQFSQIIANLEAPEGHLAVRGRLGRKTAFIDNAVLELERTKLRIAGVVNRQFPQPSHLTASGTLAWEDLAALPIAALQPVKQWQLRGDSDLELEVEGPLAAIDKAHIESRLRAERLTIGSVALEQALLIFEQHDRTLHASMPAGWIAGGKFTGELTIEPRQQNRLCRMQADLIGLQLDQLKEAVTAWRRRAVSGQASTHASLSGLLGQPNTWIGDGWLNVQGSDLADVPLLDNLLRGLFGVLADALGGLDTLRRAKLTQASVTWQLSKQRIYTEDLRLGGLAGVEPVAVYAKGSVGLDQTLDFVIEPELSEGVLLEAPSTASLSNAILKAAGQLERLRRLIGRHRLTGTLQKPEYRFEIGGAPEIMRQAAPAPANLLQQGLQGILDAVHPQESQHR